LLPNLVTSTLVAALWTAVTTLAGLFIHWPIQFTANYPGLSNALSLFLHLTAACIAVANGLVGFLVNLVPRSWLGDAANEDNQGQGVENVVVESTEEERTPLVNRPDAAEDEGDLPDPTRTLASSQDGAGPL